MENFILTLFVCSCSFQIIKKKVFSNLKNNLLFGLLPLFLFLLGMANDFNWKSTAELNKVKLPYMAVVVTDVHKNIVWVNGYFETMTGYTKAEVLNKNPKFLQGKATDTLTLHTIRKKINGQRKFKGTLINYKKNGEEYRCNVDIQPIYNMEGIHTHYIAFETDR